MFFSFKRILAISLAFISVVCAGCAKTEKQEENNNNLNSDVVVNNAVLPNVDDDMAPDDAEKIDIQIGLVKNSPSVLGAAQLFVNSENNSAYEKYMPVIYNTVNELYSAFCNGELGIAVMPPDKAAAAYNQTNCYAVAVTCGSNYYIAENGETVHNISDLEGKTVTTSEEDAVAKAVLAVIAKSNGVNVNFATVPANNDLIDGLQTGTINLAVIQEPYLSSVASESIRSAVDLYDSWQDAVDAEMPTAVMVVNKNFVSEQSVPFQFFMKDYSASAAIARRDAQETAQAAVKFALIDNVDACRAALPGCGIIFDDGSEMKDMLSKFYTKVSDVQPDVLNGVVPDENFYFANGNN